MTDDRTAPTLRERLRAVPVLQGEPPPWRPDLAPPDPVPLFLDWLDAAIEAGVADPHAVTLSTADGQGYPDARVLILKDVEAEGAWSFASATGSAKGRQLAANPHAALTFWWPAHGRQIRLRGPVEQASSAASEADLAARSPSARALVLLDRQGRPLGDPDDAARLVEEAENRLDAEPATANWAVYRLLAESVEFWQADRARLHQRLHYARHDSGWSSTRLWP